MSAGLLLFFLAAAGSGCSTMPPRMTEDRSEPAQTLDVSGVVTVPVGIGKLDPVMPVGQKVGSVYNRFGKAKTELRSGLETSGTYRKYFYEELRKAGYRTAGNETIFEAHDLTKAQVIIGGDIVDAKVNVFQGMKTETIEYDITIFWRVFDRKTQKEVFEAQTRGAAKSEFFLEAEVEAFRTAFLKLLAQSDFVDALKD